MSLRHVPNFVHNSYGNACHLEWNALWTCRWHPLFASPGNKDLGSYPRWSFNDSEPMEGHEHDILHNGRDVAGNWGELRHAELLGLTIFRLGEGFSFSWLAGTLDWCGDMFILLEGKVFVCVCELLGVSLREFPHYPTQNPNGDLSYDFHSNFHHHPKCLGRVKYVDIFVHPLSNH